MKDVVVIGAGEIGTTLVGVLAATNDYQVTLVGRSADALSWLRQGNCISYRVADVEDSSKGCSNFPPSCLHNAASVVRKIFR